jgi:hypothetical protein
VTVTGWPSLRTPPTTTEPVVELPVQCAAVATQRGATIDPEQKPCTHTCTAQGALPTGLPPSDALP